MRSLRASGPLRGRLSHRGGAPEALLPRSGQRGLASIAAYGGHAFPSRFQFERTRPIRAAVYRMARLSTRETVLDVGSGDGLVAAEMASRTGRPICALDLAPGTPPLENVRTVAGDARALPFPDGSLDAVVFHFLLLWLPDPLAALREARRVLKPQGAAMILAEPDLSSRVDEPDTGLGKAIAGAVHDSGGHLDVGAWLEGGLRRAGFRPAIRAASHEWTTITDPAEAEYEVAFLRDQGRLSSEEALSMAAAERAAILSGLRRVRLPLYYGMGLKG